jgi:kynurenine formamidase
MDPLRCALASLVALIPAAAGLAADPSEPRTVLDLARLRIVDLTHVFDAQTVYWPTAPSTFALTRLHHGISAGGFFYSANSFCTPEHGGTHIDAPIHFAESHRAVDDIPVEQLIAPAVVIDVSGKAESDADYRLTRADAEAWEKRHGRIAARTIVLLRTGWSQRWPDRKRYLGDDTPGDATKLHFPSYGREAAQLLVEQRGVAALGVDTASIDHGPSQDFPVHQIASRADVPGLENLAGLEELPEVGAWILALPMKIGGGSGSPLRIVALVPR